MKQGTGCEGDESKNAVVTPNFLGPDWGVHLTIEIVKWTSSGLAFNEDEME